jgi:prevent-host-death family protein
MEALGIEEARRQLGEIIDRARLADDPTPITRHGKTAAVVVGSDWYATVIDLLDELEALDEYRDRMAALRSGRRVAGLGPRDDRVVHHIDGNPRNNYPANLEIKESRKPL